MIAGKDMSTCYYSIVFFCGLWFIHGI
jgi:hypothetical protein